MPASPNVFFFFLLLLVDSLGVLARQTKSLVMGHMRLHLRGASCWEGPFRISFSASIFAASRK